MSRKIFKLFFLLVVAAVFARLLSMSIWVYPDMWWYKDRGVLLSLYYAMIYAAKPLALIVLIGVVYVLHGKIDFSKRILRMFALIGAVVQTLIGSSQYLIFYNNVLSVKLPTYVTLNKMGWLRVIEFHGWVLGYLLGWAIVRMYLVIINRDSQFDLSSQKASIWGVVIWGIGITSYIFPKLLYASGNWGMALMELKKNIAVPIGEALDSSLFFYIWGAIAVWLVGQEGTSQSVIFRRKLGIIGGVILAYFSSWMGTHTGNAPDVDFFRMFCNMIAIPAFPAGYIVGYAVGWLIEIGKN